jgi:hypothetical protein
MWQADLSLGCAVCGGDDFREVFPVPAEVYMDYGAAGDAPRRFVATVYACVQCGHVVRFIDWDAPAEDDAGA